ncbi:hypothetical protein ACFVWN_00865 [Nocardiopsis flavescens]|uniref:hypothetical protein n=1 Tax=Nocardiopsis flavescens TaxID=758803 RepID=UPI003666829E
MDHLESPHSPHRGTPDTARNAPRPGWIELVVGLAVMALVAFVLAPQLNRLDMSGPTAAVLSGVVSGGGGLIAFAAAAMLRVRSWRAFGVRATTARWLLIGAAAGLVAFVARILTVFLVGLFVDMGSDTQASYAAGAGAGALSLALTMLTLAVLTPWARSSCSAGWWPPSCCATAPWSVWSAAPWCSRSCTASTRSCPRP